MVTVWATKLKRIISAYLATENNLYLTTEDGLYLEIIDLQDFSETQKSNTLFSVKVKN